MNKDLQTAIHRYAEDREIDYISAQKIAERYGKKITTQKDLIEWKSVIDKYLKTFEQSAWNEIEEELGLKEKNSD